MLDLDMSICCWQEMGPVPAQFAEAFGLVIQCRDRVGEQAVHAQSVHTLQQAMQPGTQAFPSYWDFSNQDYKEV